MSEPTIYHNPKCSKSRATLALLEERGCTPTVIEYLRTPPDPATLALLCQRLGCTAREIVRRKELVFAELELEQCDEPQLLQAISDNPILLERPIVCLGERAAIGRPPENVLTLLASPG